MCSITFPKCLFPLTFFSYSFIKIIRETTCFDIFRHEGEANCLIPPWYHPGLHSDTAVGHKLGQHLDQGDREEEHSEGEP